MADKNFKARHGLEVSGDATLTGDLAVNGGDITTTQTTANIVDTTATTVNAFGAATAVNIGAATGYTTVDNNIVKGAVRAPFSTNSDVYGFGAAGTTGRGLGISVDNSADTTKRTNIVTRAYSGGTGTAPRNPIIGETARNTAASPYRLSANDNILEFLGNGYYDDLAGTANWSSASSGALSPLIVRGRAREAWSGQSNLGTEFQILTMVGGGVAPTAGNYVTTTFNGVSGNIFTSDAHTFQTRTAASGGAGITQLAIDSSGNVTVTGDLRINGNDIQASDGNTNITLTSNTLTAFAGDIQVNGNDIQASDGNTNITMTSNTLTAFAGDIKVTGNDIQASDGNTNITLTSNTLTAFAGDIRVNGNDIQASDGNNNITLTSNTLTTFSGDIQVNGNDIQASDGNTNITLTSNTLTAFAGDIKVGGNDIQASDGSTNITLTSNTLTAFAGDIKVGGNDIQASDGNTAITLEPVASYNPNTQIVANLLKGDIRNTTTESNGDMWAQGTAGYRGITVDNSQNTAKRPGYILRSYSGGASAPRSTFVGETARGTAASPVRLSTNDNMLEFFATGYYDNGSGSAGWMADANVAPGMIMRARASENWLSASNMGTEFQILLTPNGVTQTSGGAAYNNSLVLNPTAGNSYRSDSHTFVTRSSGAGGTNTTQLAIDSSGNVTVTGDLRINGNDIVASDGNPNITLTSNTLTAFAGDIKVGGNDIQASDGNNNITLTSNTLTAFAGDIKVGGDDIQNSTGDTTITMSTGASALTTFAGDIQINGNEIYDSNGDIRVYYNTGIDRVFFYGTRNQYYYEDVPNASTIYFNPGDKSGATQGERYTQFNMINRNTNSDTHSLFSMTTYNFDNGTGNYSATLADEIIGRIGATGQYGTGTSPQTNQSCADVEFRAAENFTASANGGRVVFKAVEIGTTNTLVDVIAVDTSNAYVRSDNFYFRDNGNTALTSANINYTRTYGEFAYTAGTITIAAQNTVYAFPLDTTLSSSGTSISNTSRINISVSGHYKIIMSLQAAMETNSIGQFDFWLRKNGTDVANSATQVDLLKDQKSVVAMDWLVESDGNDYWEIMYASNSANYANLDFPYIPAWTTPTNPYARPAAPPILVNVIPAGM